MGFPYRDSAFYSTVKNISGQTKVFGFLPPHGRTLAPNQEFTVFGNILSAIGGQRGGRAESRRDIVAFENAIVNGYLQVTQTPSPILQDEVTGTSVMLEVENGSLSMVTPEWQISDQAPNVGPFG